MKQQTKHISLTVYFLLLFFAACKKSDFLNAKPTTTLTVPSTLTDFQSLLDNYDVINQTPALGDISSDNYFYDYPDWQSVSAIEQNCYIWGSDIYGGIGNILDWDIPYQQIFASNVIIEGLNKIDIKSVDSNAYDNIKGSAVFVRAKAFFDLAQLFASTYDSTTADKDLGIPLRLSTDVNKTDQRSSVAQTYNQIISDLNSADSLIKNSKPSSYINRPIKPSVLALLSRVYMAMRNYKLAGAYADSALQVYDTLIDYNTLDTTASIPLSRTNVETMYQSYQVSVYVIDGADAHAQIDSVLFNSYSSNDLRKEIFYQANTDGRVFMKGTYNGTYALFSGLATNEMYLNRAECAARAGDVTSAMNDLNLLLSKRYITGTYIPKVAINANDALMVILNERRKELPFTSLRWTDLRRLNKDGANITLTRILNGQAYTLVPNSELYVLPIPQNEISASGIQQNPR
jgi:hypothetical protein